MQKKTVRQYNKGVVLIVTGRAENVMEWESVTSRMISARFYSAYSSTGICDNERDGGRRQIGVTRDDFSAKVSASREGCLFYDPVRINHSY